MFMLNNNVSNIESFGTPKIMSRSSPKKEPTFVTWALLLKCAYISLRDI